MLDFISDLLAVIGHALRFQPALLVYVRGFPHANWLTFGVAALAGASQLLGQSAVLLVNRVSPGRFLLTLLLNGIIFALDLLIWSASLRLVAGWLYGITIPVEVIVRIICVGVAPLTLGFLMLLPYFGDGVGWVLRVWSALVILTAFRDDYTVTLWQALVCTVGGWLLIELMNRTLGRPLLWLRDWLWRIATGAPYDADIRRKVAEISEELSHELPSRSSR